MQKVKYYFSPDYPTHRLAHKSEGARSRVVIFITKKGSLKNFLFIK